MTVLKKNSTLTTGTGVGDTQPGMKLTFASGSYAGMGALMVVDYLGAPIFAVLQSSNAYAITYGDQISAYPTIFTEGGGMRVKAGTNPAGLQWPDGTAAFGAKMHSGTGAPSSTTVGTAVRGDLYLRRDTPSTSGQRVYRCTVAGTPGTWVGVL